MGRKLGACHYTVREEIGKVVESKRGKKEGRKTFLLAFGEESVLYCEENSKNGCLGERKRGWV